MKFHRFPHLVQRELCSLLHPFDLVLLSFCSDRTRRAVKKANGFRKFEIWVSGSEYFMTLFYRNDDEFDYFFNVYREWLPVPRSVIYINIDEIDVGISWKIKDELLSSFNVHNQRHVMLIYKYIGNLFNASEEIYLKTDRFEYDFSSVKRSYLQNSEFTLDQLRRFYQYNPEQEFSEVNCKLAFTWSISNGKSVFMVRNLILRGTIPGVRQCFRMFKGEHAYFEDTYMWSMDIIDISEEWMKRTNDELKSMIFKPKEEYDIEETKTEIRKISCGNERKQRFYSYESIITEYEKFPTYIFDCTDGIDIRRDTDGKMATITLFPDYVSFFVWE